MPTFAYKHVKMVSQCPTTTHTRHQSRDQPTTDTQHVHTSLFCGSAFSTAIAAICRRSQPATADKVTTARDRACEPLSRAAAAAAGSNLQQLVETPAAEPGHRLRWSVRRPAQRCAAHAPPQRRRQRRRGTRVPLNGLMLAEGGGR